MNSVLASSRQYAKDMGLSNPEQDQRALDILSLEASHLARGDVLASWLLVRTFTSFL